MGVRWPHEEWKPNMVELEVSIGFDERNAQTKSDFFVTDDG